MATAVVTSHELSVPAYLMVEMDNDFTRGIAIARGGMGTICLAETIQGTALAERVGMNAMVAKIGNQALPDMQPHVRDTFY